MVPLSLVVCLSLLALAGATNVRQCSGRSIPNLRENVELPPCKKPPCKLLKGTGQDITIAFEPEKDADEVNNYVTAEVFGVPLPFIGVHQTSICDKVYTPEGERASCPLKAGTKYIYKDSFPVLKGYPTLNTKVHWALNDGDEDIICFEVNASIQN